MRAARSIPIAVLAAAAVVVPAGAVAGDGPSAQSSATRTVSVRDDFFSPSRLTVSRGTTVKWSWSRRNSDTHDVKLGSKPRGVRGFHSSPARRGATFQRRLNKAGTYRVLCTFHDGMRMRIDVTR